MSNVDGEIFAVERGVVALLDCHSLDTPGSKGVEPVRTKVWYVAEVEIVGYYTGTLTFAPDVDGGNRDDCGRRTIGGEAENVGMRVGLIEGGLLERRYCRVWGSHD
jgi:hypothetical protein